jgi:hypothetical protein
MDITIDSGVMHFTKPPEEAVNIGIKFEFYRPAARHCFVLRWYDKDGNKLRTEGLWGPTYELDAETKVTATE